jgi:hypothetical protein
MSSTLDGGEPDEKKMYMDAKGSRIEVPLNIMVDIISSNSMTIIHNGKEYYFNLSNISFPMSTTLREMIFRRSSIRNVDASFNPGILLW